MGKRLKTFSVHYYFLVVICLFVLLSTILFFLSNFLKTFHIYNDEFYYLELAKSIFYGRGMVMHQIPTSFQKILYPAVIAPCFAITNSATRLTAITLVNSVLLSSSVFPIYLIGRSLKLKTPSLTILLGFACVSPILIYALSFMAEILYYPLSLWVLYLWLVNQDKRSYVMAGLSGVLCYALYLCKETALMVLIILVVLELVIPLFEKLYNHRQYKESLSVKGLINAGIYVASFFLMFLIFKLTLFKNLGASYNQSDPSAINSVAKFFYVIYAFIYYITGVSLLVLFIPVVYPFFCYKKINKNTQKLFLFAILMLLVAAFHTAYSVSVREDYNIFRVAPRLISRYMCPAIIVFIMVLISILEDRSQCLLSFSRPQKRKLWIVLGSLLAVFVFVYKCGPMVNLAGSIIPLPYYYLCREVFLKFTNYQIDFVYCSLNVVLNVVVALLVLLINYLLTNKKPTVYHHAIVGVILSTFLATLAYYQYHYINVYSYKGEDVAAVVRVNDFISSLTNDTNVLWVSQSTVDDCREYDTFIDHTERVMIVDIRTLENDLLSRTHLSNPTYSFTFTDIRLEKNYPVKSHIEYYIEKTNLPHYLVCFDDCEKVEEYSNDQFTIYRNLHPENITIRYF